VTPPKNRNPEKYTGRLSDLGQLGPVFCFLCRKRPSGVTKMQENLQVAGPQVAEGAYTAPISYNLIPDLGLFPTANFGCSGFTPVFLPPQS